MTGAKHTCIMKLFLTYLAISVALCAGPFACRHTAPNTVVTYLQGADQQWENMDQQREVEKAINNMLTLTPDELRNRRYANYQMQPGAWTITELLDRYFVSRGLVYIDENRFYHDVTDRAARAVIRDHLRRMQESPALERGDGLHRVALSDFTVYFRGKGSLFR